MEHADLSLRDLNDSVNLFVIPVSLESLLGHSAKASHEFPQRHPVDSPSHSDDHWIPAELLDPHQLYSLHWESKHSRQLPE